MKKKQTLTLMGCCIAVLSFSQAFFTNMAQQAGIEHTYVGNSGGGVSFCDFDGDGLDDITLATGFGEALYFYRNKGNGSFEKLFPLVTHTDEAKQLLWVDFDNDGDKDLFVATFSGANRLYQNQGNLQLVDITLAAGLPLNAANRSFGACFGDYDRDGWLDLYVGERKFPQTLGPNENHLFRNTANLDGSGLWFSEVSQATGTADTGRIPFCSAFFDYNGDKWPDIYTANDKLSVNTLLKNEGHQGGSGVVFSDAGPATGADLSMDAMCVAVGDYDNDGWQDVYISDIENGNELLHNLNGTAFEEIADELGVGFYGIAWGCNFLDAENDGDLDLYVSGMNVGTDEISSTFYENNGDGTFIEPPAGFIGDTVSSFNNAIGDFNDDGLPDIMVVNTLPFKAQLWENASENSGNWLKIKLKGVLSNRDAVGTKLEVYAGGQYQMRYTHCGIGFLGQNSGTEIIGLGSSSLADSIVVTWPTGHVDRLSGVTASQCILVVEGSTTGGQIEVDDDVQLSITAVSEQVRTDFLFAVPNPGTDRIQIRMLDDSVFSQFAFVNSAGHVVKSGILVGAGPWEVSTAELASGLYFLVMWNPKGEKASTSWAKK